MDKMFRVTTEGDVEGRSTRTCGIVKAKSKQHVEAFLEANPTVFNKYYSFYIDEIEFIDISNNNYEIINKCSKCDYIGNTNYCPNCGSKIIQKLISK